MYSNRRTQPINFVFKKDWNVVEIQFQTFQSNIRYEYFDIDSCETQ